MEDKGLADLIGDGKRWIERPQGVLRNEGDTVAENLPPLAFGEIEERAALEADGTMLDARHPRQQPENRKRGDRLSASRLADHRNDLVGADRKTDPVDDPQHLAAAWKCDRELLDVENRSLPGHRLILEMRVEEIPQSVAQEIEAEDAEEQCRAGNDAEPRRLRHESSPGVDHVAPGRLGRLGAEA